MSREPNAHFGLPDGYPPWTIAVNVTWIEREFNACQTHRSTYLSIFNRFPVIQPLSLKVRYFSTLYCTFCLHWVRPWDNRGNCYMDRKRIQCWSNASQLIPIYIFNHFWNIAIYRWRVIDFQQSRKVNERFLPHFVFPGYAPVKIAVNVTRLKRGFNACKTPRCIYPSIFNRFWDIASYCSKIATFSYPT